MRSQCLATSLDRRAGLRNCSGLHSDGNFDAGVFVTGSEVQRWGLGVVQEIDSAAMHLFARWQHQDLDVNLIGFNATSDCSGSHGCHTSQGFDSLDLFQLGGVIFF